MFNWFFWFEVAEAVFDVHAFIEDVENEPDFFFFFVSFRNGRASQHKADSEPGERSGVQGADAYREQVIGCGILSSFPSQ